MVLCVLVSTGHAAVTTYTNEALFLNQIANAISEAFEGAAWSGVRSTDIAVTAADSITSLGVTWSSSDGITTSISAGRSGYGLFAYPHGVPDILVGEAGTALSAIGFWVTTSTPIAKVNVVLDNTTVVTFNDIPIGAEYTFLGLVSTTAFSRFEIRELEGTPGDQKYIFIDDVTYAAAAAAGNLPPTARAGADQTVLEGNTVYLDAGHSADADDGIATYLWSQVNGPLVAILPDASRVKPHFVAPVVDRQGATLVFRLVVTDTGGLQDTDLTVVTIKNRSLPQAVLHLLLLDR
jgi:hypothetical protein